MNTPNFHRQQQGVTLFLTLMFLVVLTLIAVAAMNTGTLEEKMARNSRDYNTAFQAAEAGLRDGEADLTGLGSRSPGIDCSAFMGAAGSCVEGLCSPANAGETPVWDVAANWTGTNSVEYANYTSAVAASLPSSSSTPGGVSQPPRYLIEYLGVVSGSCAGGGTFRYRITAKAWGATANTTVMLQETVIK